MKTTVLATNQLGYSAQSKSQSHMNNTFVEESGHKINKFQVSHPCNEKVD